MIFQGEEFEANSDFAMIRSLLLDYFHGQTMVSST